MAAAPGSTAAAEQHAAEAGGGERDSEESDDEGAVAAAAPPPAAPAPATTPAPGSAASTPGSMLLLSPRLRTRLFAAQLLLRIPELVSGADPRHTDLAAAQAAAKAGAGSDWLVLRLQQLVDLAFRMASGQLEVGLGRQRWPEGAPGVTHTHAACAPHSGPAAHDASAPLVTVMP